MNFNLERLSLRKQIIIIFAGFVALAAIYISITSYFQESLREIKNDIAVAREVQLLPKQLAAACKLYLKGDTESKKGIEEISDAFETSLSYYMLKEKAANQQRSSDSILLDHQLFTKINRKWVQTKFHIENALFEPAFIDTVVQESKTIPLNDTLNTVETTQKILNLSNPKVARSNNYIQRSSKELTRLGKQLKEEKIRQYKETDDALTYASFTFLGVIFLAVILLLILIHKKIFTPVHDLDKIAAQVSSGDLSEKSAYKANNELGRISRSVNKITENLRNATAFIKAIEKGKLEEEYEGLSTKELHQDGLEQALLNMRNEMKKVAQEEEERKWATQGLAKFVEILRSANDVHSLGDTVISNLVNYTKSNQGGIYVLNEEDEENKTLELISLYAFNKKKYDKRSYRLGEGLIGQAYLEKETIYLLEIPDEYISITSGLGGANPKAILLVPLKINDIIYGVVELASFNDYKPYEIAFVEKLAESIASTVAGVKNNDRMKRLLEESQALTEQMQAQEEEMRQNMEELSATQEEMSRKEVEMSAQLTAINNSLASAEFDMNGTVIKVNENYARFLGYTHPEDLRELSFAVLNAGDIGSLWEDLKNGVSRSGDFVKLKKSGDQVHVNTTYTTVKNDSGDYYKVIELVLSEKSSEATADARLMQHMQEAEESLRQNMEELEITQEQLDIKLRHSEAKLKALDDVVKIITYNTEGVVTSINKAVEAFTGVDMAEMHGRHITELLEENDLSALQKSKSTTIKSATGVTKIDAEVHQDIETGLNYIVWI